jgi:hypothetical protein
MTNTEPCQVFFGAPAPIRTEKTAPFERADFTDLSTGAIKSKMTWQSVLYNLKGTRHDYRYHRTGCCYLPREFCR